MPSSLHVPIELYLHSSYDPDAEYVDGEIQERAMGEYDHAAWQAAIQEYFRKHRLEWNIRAFSELRVKVSTTRYRVPDVTVLDRDLPIEQIVTKPPIAVFEVLSPEDRLARTMEKCSDYEGMGIKTILVIDPKGPHYRYQKGKLEPLESAIFDLPESRCIFDLAEIEKLLD